MWKYFKDKAIVREARKNIQPAIRELYTYDIPDRVAAVVEDIIKEEGVVTRAYKDKAGAPTIGVGTAWTYPSTGEEIQAKDTIDISRAVGEAIVFQQNIDEKLNSLGIELNLNQYRALSSLAYNIGVDTMMNSSVIKNLQSGNVDKAGDSFLKYNKITNPKTGKKQIDPILVKRRERERSMFLQNTPNYIEPPQDKNSPYTPEIKQQPKPKDRKMLRLFGSNNDINEDVDYYYSDSVGDKVLSMFES